MKKVYKQQYNVYNNKKCLDKNAIARYILLAFFAFVFIGSILGIVAFSRTNKKESAFNVVSANADFSDEIDGGSFSGINLLKPALGSTYLDSSGGSTFSITYSNHPLGRCLSINSLDNYHIRTWYTACPVSYLFDVEDLQNSYDESPRAAYFIAFRYYHDNELLDLPEFRIWSYVDEVEAGFQVGYFPYEKIGENEYLYYCILKTLTFSSLNFDFYSEKGMGAVNAIPMFDFQVKAMPYYTSYNPTKEEILEELSKTGSSSYDEGYQDGLNDNTVGYDKGYQDGLNDNTGAYDNGFRDGFEQGAEQSFNASLGLFENATYDISIASHPYKDDVLPPIDVWKQEVSLDSDRWLNIQLIVNSAINTSGVSSTQEIGYYGARFGILFDIEDRNFINNYFALTIYNDKYDLVELTKNKDTNNLGFDLVMADRTYVPAVVSYGLYPYTYSLSFPSIDDGDVVEVTHIRIQGYCLYGMNSTFRLQDTGADYAYGYDTGKQNGYNECLEDMSLLLNEQYQKGYDTAYALAKRIGFNQGVLSSNKNTFASLITSAVDVPIKAFTSLFNFEILGVNLANFFFALLTCCLVLAIVKLIL